jgi:arsenate reductase-like glutaredoxin family protein
MNNKSIDKMAEQFTSLEELQAYCDSQYKTLLTLNQKINSQEKEIAKLKETNANLQRDIAVSGASRKEEGQFTTSDEETTCVIQLAMIKSTAMQRELIMDEVKRFEILAKTLIAIRGREVKKEVLNTDNISTADLMKHYETALKDPQ